MTPSANGFILSVTNHAGEVFELVAAWAAPWFALINNCDAPKPMLYHATSREDAEHFAHGASSGKPCILNAEFEVIA